MEVSAVGILKWEKTKDILAINHKLWFVALPQWTFHNQEAEIHFH